MISELFPDLIKVFTNVKFQRVVQQKSSHNRKLISLQS